MTDRRTRSPAPEAPPPKGRAGERSPRPGLVLHGRYRLLRQVGRGAMGEVWVAVDGLLGRRVAVKLLRPGASDDLEQRARSERFLREARTAASLSHPNVTAVFDVGQEEGWPFIVLELVDGTTLEQRLERGPLPPREAERIAASIAAALAAAHRAGIVHRDVKPANVIVSGTGMVKVTDLGIAGSVEADPDDDGAMYGTLPYVAPERLRGPSAGPPADVYALGVVLYEMLAGRRPFEAGSAEALRRLQEAGPPPLTHVPGLERSVADACFAAMSFEPEARPSASALAAMLGNTVPATTQRLEGTPADGAATVVIAPAGTAAIGAPVPGEDPSRPAGPGTEVLPSPPGSPKDGIGPLRRATVAVAVAGTLAAAGFGLVEALSGQGTPTLPAITTPPATTLPSPTVSPTPSKPTPTKEKHDKHDGHGHNHGGGGH